MFPILAGVTSPTDEVTSKMNLWLFVGYFVFVEHYSGLCACGKKLFHLLGKLLSHVSVDQGVLGTSSAFFHVVSCVTIAHHEYVTSTNKSHSQAYVIGGYVYFV
jgi:hypothetical protein